MGRLLTGSTTYIRFKVIISDYAPTDKLGFCNQSLPDKPDNVENMSKISVDSRLFCKLSLLSNASTLPANSKIVVILP